MRFALSTMGLLLLLALAACPDEPEESPPLYFPPVSGNWETTDPASLGWNVSAIPAFLDYLRDNNTRAFLVLKDGRIVMEHYFGKQLLNPTQDFSATSVWYWASAGKTLTAALVGIAQTRGAGIRLTAPTSDYLGVGWTGLSPAQESQITVWHQLTMTTGLDDAVANPDCTDKACLVFKAEPGTRWAYHNAPYTLLDDVISAATGKTLNAFLTEEIKSTTGMDGQYIQTGDNNVFYSTPRSMARFGLLLLAKGRWRFQQIILPPYVDTMTTTSQSLNPSYGYLTWLNGKGASMIPGLQTVFPFSISPQAPTDMFAAMGKNGQLINIVPSAGLVLVRMGDMPDNVLVPFTFQDALWQEFRKVIR